MKTCIATLHQPNYLELANLVLSNKKEYCDLHGYSLEVKTDHFELGLGFSKIDFILKLLDKYEIVAWQDLDTIIMNFQKPIEEFFKSKDFIISKDCHGINAGSFLVRRSEGSIKLLKFIMSKYEDYKNDCWHEQRVLIHNEHTEIFQSNVEIVSQNLINSYFYDHYRINTDREGQYKSGDWLLHLPGMNLQERVSYYNSDRVKNSIIK